MLHDPILLDRLSSFPVSAFSGTVYRATRMNLDPLTPSLSGGRWALKREIAVLYTSLSGDGALAELAFHWGQFVPLPSQPAAVHEIAVTAQKTLRLLRGDLDSLGVEVGRYDSVNYEQTQRIGAAVAFLEYDGLIAPSARWDCDNLMIFSTHHSMDDENLKVITTRQVDWLAWAREHKFISP